MKTLLKIILALALALCAYAAYESYSSYLEGQRLAEEQLKRDLEEAEKYARIPLRGKIGRMFIVGLDSCAIKNNDPIVNKISKYGVGGVILFAYNIPASGKDSTSKQRLTTLCADLQSLADYKLMIGIDQEGGKVMRLRPSNGYPDLPSHAWLGKVDDEDTTRHYVSQTAAVLNELGINLNYAPCVDVNMNPDCPVIGKVDRAFSADPAMVGRHASYFIDEHRKNGVLTAVKHFPGHGSSVTDSHNGMTDISATWKPEELVPFKTLFDSGCCDMVMVGHIFNRQIDSLYPASLSEATVSGLLRSELGWQGLAVSDDLGMKAISANYSLEETLMLSINAGIDMLMLIANGTPERLEHSIDLIEGMVLDGRIAEGRITEAYRRIDKVLETLL